jgi:hypothetical protein
MTINNAVFLDVTPRGSCKNQRFGGSYRLHHQGGRNQRAKTSVAVMTLVTATVISSLLILSTLNMEAMLSPETLVLTRATRRPIPEDIIFLSHRSENLKSYNIHYVFVPT